MTGRSDEKLTRRDWMDTPAAHRVIDAISAGGADVRFVGGCVRDALLGRAVNDVDIATPDEPPEVTAMAEAAGLKVVPTGIDHGTVTVIADGQPFEVTSLREDISTDGRRAVVAFTRDWQHDAARRDFTMNALSCRPDGQLFDYFGGAADARAGRVRFVGDADLRLQEDVLRLLRFYRFHAWYGTGAPDPEARAACRKHVPRLPTLSAERVREELLRLLRAPAPAPVVAMMAEDGALEQIVPQAHGGGLAAARLEGLCRLDRAADSGAPGATARDAAGMGDVALRRLAVLLPADADPQAVADDLRLSRRQAAHLAAVRKAAADLDLAAGAQQRRQALYRLGPAVYADAALVAAAEADPAAAAGAAATALAAAAAWEPQTLPVTGADLVAMGVPAGPEVGELLRRLEEFWLQEDFAPDRAQLLARAEDWRDGQ